jgi:hypothetical protein
VAVFSALALFAGQAAATILVINHDTFRMVWPELRLSNGSFEVRCPVTLEGTLHANLFHKVSGALLGYITRAGLTSTRCSGEGARFLTESLPWHVRYDSFTGTLPTITTLKLQMIGTAILARASGTSCLYASTATHPMVAIAGLTTGREGARRMTEVRFDETKLIPSGSGGLCGIAEGRLAGTTSSVTVLGGTESLEVLLEESDLGTPEAGAPTFVIRWGREEVQIMIGNTAPKGAADIIFGQDLRFDTQEESEYFELKPGETCEGATLIAPLQNSCQIEVRYKRGAMERPREALVKLSYTTGGVGGTDTIRIVAENT